MHKNICVFCSMFLPIGKNIGYKPTLFKSKWYQAVNFGDRQARHGRL